MTTTTTTWHPTCTKIVRFGAAIFFVCRARLIGPFFSFFFHGPELILGIQFSYALAHVASINAPARHHAGRLADRVVYAQTAETPVVAILRGTTVVATCATAFALLDGRGGMTGLAPLNVSEDVEFTAFSNLRRFFGVTGVVETIARGLGELFAEAIATFGDGAKSRQAGLGKLRERHDGHAGFSDALDFGFFGGFSDTAFFNGHIFGFGTTRRDTPSGLSCRLLDVGDTTADVLGIRVDEQRENGILHEPPRILQTRVAEAKGKDGTDGPNNSSERGSTEQEGIQKVEFPALNVPVQKERNNLRCDPRVDFSDKQKHEHSELLSKTQVIVQDERKAVLHRNLHPTLSPTQALVPCMKSGGGRQLATNQLRVRLSEEKRGGKEN